MATAIVTGSSSGIGEAIALMLLENGYDVIGLSRSRGIIDHPAFHHIPCDLRDPRQIESLKIPLCDAHPTLLVNCAGFGRFEPHEELGFETINSMIALNLTAPVLLSNLVLRELKKCNGMIVNITSIEATRHSKFSALYTATKTGLRAFGHSLYEEVRAAGVGVLTLNPDMTDTPFFDELRFGVSENDDAKLFATDVAASLQAVLNLREGAGITELTIRSRKFGIAKKR